MSTGKKEYGNLTLIGCGPVVAGRKGTDRHFLELLFDIRLVTHNHDRPGLQVGRNTKDVVHFHTL